MIEYDIIKYKPEVVYDVNGVKKYLCIIRKMLIKISPEETVRQSFLNYLISEIKIPKTQILVEELVTRHQTENQMKSRKRIDILILDHDDIPFIAYECKRDSENFTATVYNQVMDYFEVIDTIEYVGVVIGNELDLSSFAVENEKLKLIKYATHPAYLTLCSGEGEVLVDEFDEYNFIRPNFIEPIHQVEMEEYYEYGIIGNGTDKKLIPFLVNFYGWIINEEDKLLSDQDLTDIGVKFTKFGNAGGGFFTQQYRAFLVDNLNLKPIIFIGLNGMSSGINSAIGTSLFVAIETNEHSHASLQLRCDKYVKIVNNRALIWHDGTITVGKLGAAKKQDLLEFIAARPNTILHEGEIILGNIDFSVAITSQQDDTKKFITNLFQYALLRDEFRQFKKSMMK